jgi:hypothetical protein
MHQSLNLGIRKKEFEFGLNDLKRHKGVDADGRYNSI